MHSFRVFRRIRGYWVGLDADIWVQFGVQVQVGGYATVEYITYFLCAYANLEVSGSNVVTIR